MDTQIDRQTLNNKANQAAAQGKKAVNQATTAASGVFDSVMESPIAEQAIQQYEGLRDMAVERYESGVSFAKKNPAAVIAGAVGVGLVIGLLLRSNSRR